ncbi:DUF1617 family protein [Alkalicoccobacillus plakortidis]|uniref:DUF1617 family protein n=1 Tax=Alkalicoccobacillus plakortidis TaxID=444060 RepID=A0ABT0XJX8_9BACI|nr:DUF1617 family protein [Alkalicoccobacillus plakortidis]MCM2675539.1 DUF1617 family protein [Alkalicoccobacillus plakortidis]
MKIEIQNDQIVQAVNLLFNLPLKGKQSRHRTKFITLLEKRLKEVNEDQLVIVKEHAHLDEDGEPKKVENDTKWDIKDENLEQFGKEIDELYEERYVIEGGNKTDYLITLKSILDECQEEFRGQKAMTYDMLCDLFEEEEETQKTETKTEE